MQVGIVFTFQFGIFLGRMFDYEKISGDMLSWKINWSHRSICVRLRDKGWFDDWVRQAFAIKPSEKYCWVSNMCMLNNDQFREALREVNHNHTMAELNYIDRSREMENDSKFKFLPWWTTHKSVMFGSDHFNTLS